MKIIFNHNDKKAIRCLLIIFAIILLFFLLFNTVYLGEVLYDIFKRCESVIVPFNIFVIDLMSDIIQKLYLILYIVAMIALTLFSYEYYVNLRRKWIKLNSNMDKLLLIAMHVIDTSARVLKAVSIQLFSFLV